MFTVNNKSPICVKTCSDLTQSCIKHFFLSVLNIGIIEIGSSFVPSCVKSVKDFKNDHSLWPVNSEIQVI